MKRPLIALGLLLSLALACNLPIESNATPAAPETRTPDFSAPATRTPLPTWTLPFRWTVTPSATLLPGQATTLPVTPLPSPTARAGIDPTLGPSAPDPSVPLNTAVPPPMPQLFMDKDVYNVLLLGRDTPQGSRSYRTDVMIIVSVNKKTGAVTMLTIPRDLYVYIPGWTMQRINTAASHGDAVKYPGGGVALLEQTILYNLGVPVHGWARIDFGGFKNVVDIIGGIEVPVACPMQDWRLKDPSLDQQNADNWELFDVNPGVHKMDGDYALWYARSRKHSSDFDRSRRQHQVLRAILEKALQVDILPKAPELYAQYGQMVDTDLGLGEILQFVPLAPTIDPSRIKSRFIGRGFVINWTTPDGAAVLLPNRGAISQLLAEAFAPPNDNTLTRAAPEVELWNGTRHTQWAALAADNMEWAGIAPIPGEPDRTDYATTTIYDFSLSPKVSAAARKELQRIFHVKDANVVTQPDSNAAYPFRVVIGEDFNSCVAPTSIIIRTTPTPETTPSSTANTNVVRAVPIVGPPPRVDGDISEWTVFAYGAGTPTFGRENWQNADDLSAVWNIAWSDSHLYLALKVRDDVYVQLASGADIYKGDSLEILLNTEPGNTTKTLGDTNFQLGISTANAEAYLWLPKTYNSPVHDVQAVTQLVEGGYNMEIAIPWTIFRTQPSVGKTFGFTLSLNDNDTPGELKQETLVTHNARRRLTDPTTWSVLVLDAP